MVLLLFHEEIFTYETLLFIAICCHYIVGRKPVDADHAARAAIPLFRDRNR